MYSHENNLEILKDNLNNLDLSILGLDKKGLIWIGGASPNGNIQVLDSNYNSKIYTFLLPI